MEMAGIQNKRVMFLAGLLGQGGAERQLFYILKSLKIMEWDPYLVTLTKGEYWENPISNLGVPIFWAGGSNSKFIRLRSILGYTKKIKPVIIQSQHFYTNIYSSIIGHLMSTTDVGAIRSNGKYEVKVSGTIWGRMNLYLPKFLAANSLAGMNYAETMGISGKRIRLLPNVVDTYTFCPVKKISNQTINILIVSSLYFPKKRVDLFIKVLCELKGKTKTPFSALIAGDGPLKPMLQQMAEEGGIYPGILNFLGFVDHIEKIYQKADILVLTSESEGTPNVIMEAMSAGLPVIATSTGGVSDLVQEGETGFLIQAGDLNGLVEKLIILIEDPKLRRQMGISGREYIKAHHSLDQLPGFLRDFYSSIL